ncbi:MAG: hypothetical protein IJC30_02270 [Alphaproteobacteria bacterium]|nr:hypothetical protein [Alphaproteobacteria bacterium]
MTEKEAMFKNIFLSFQQDTDFQGFLNHPVQNFEGRDWTYGQFLYKYFFDQVQEFNYQVRDNFKNLPEDEKGLAEKCRILFDNKMTGPDTVLKTDKIKELNLFNGDKEKENFYNSLFSASNRSVEGNPHYWHPVSQYQFLVVEHKLSQMGMGQEQIRALMQHCADKREETEAYYKEHMPETLVHVSKKTPAEMNGTIKTHLRSVDTFIDTQKYCFIAEQNSFHPELPIQGDGNSFVIWPRFKPKVMAFQMTAEDFNAKTQEPAYVYKVDMSRQEVVDSIRPCIPFWGGDPKEWVSVQNLTYKDEEVQTETVQDLTAQGKKIYLVPNPEDWKLLEGTQNLSEEQAEKRMQEMCQLGKAVDIRQLPTGNDDVHAPVTLVEKIRRKKIPVTPPKGLDNIRRRKSDNSLNIAAKKQGNGI